MSPRSSRTFPSGGELLTSKYIRGAAISQLPALRAAGIDPAPALLDAMVAYIELLLRWNRKFNLTAITDPRQIVTRNFAESFLAARWLSADAGRLCDIGSGAGFPGLALKLVLPRWHVVLLEPTAKKAAFLSEAARTLALHNVEVLRCRWEDSDLAPASLDAVTSRALGGYEELEVWAQARLRPGGKLILWLGTQDAQQLECVQGWLWERIPVPASRERVILAGTRS